MHYLRFEDVNRGEGRTNKISDNKSGNESYKASEIYINFMWAKETYISWNEVFVKVLILCTNLTSF